MSRAAKATVLGAIAASSLIVWGVHYMQKRESDTMYLGVLRDDERRKEKMRQREEEFAESQRKRELYERVQPISSKGDQPGPS
ncbi:hypothetical protein K474DRAFT_1664392 [Panus rudis PR-1116 ss-1]|nr:hypothetical protein K474DRAFT_1664392 [Panus rudis PR-1116 ss-1]